MTDLKKMTKEELIGIVQQQNMLLKSSPEARGFAVTTPNGKYSGLTAGIQFHEGQAFISSSMYGEDELHNLLNTLRGFGYEVAEMTAGEFRGETKQPAAA